MKTVTLRGVEIGAGAPKVIVPIVGRTRAYILAQAAGLAALPVDMAEWRADFYEDVLDLEKTLDTLKALRATLGDLPLLFTFRTRREGGEREISPEDYRALNLAAARSGDADAVDVEIFSGDELVRQIIDAVHAAGGAVVGSSHDHCGTPPREELTARLHRAQELGADLPKLAVTPQSPDDVLTLLGATQEMVRRRAGRPVITMSMGPLGTVSRLCGEVFGSAMTSAPPARPPPRGRSPRRNCARCWISSTGPWGSSDKRTRPAGGIQDKTRSAAGADTVRLRAHNVRPYRGPSILKFSRRAGASPCRPTGRRLPPGRFARPGAGRAPAGPRP